MKFNVACLQLTCNNQVDDNLKTILNFSKEAIQEGADFILTPENSSIFSADHKELLSKSESFENNTFIKSIQNFSKENKKWFLIGSLAIKISNIKLANRSVLINPKGEVVSWYDKFICLMWCCLKMSNIQNQKNF